MHMNVCVHMHTSARLYTWRRRISLVSAKANQTDPSFFELVQAGVPEDKRTEILSRKTSTGDQAVSERLFKTAVANAEALLSLMEIDTIAA